MGQASGVVFVWLLFAGSAVAQSAADEAMTAANAPAVFESLLERWRIERDGSSVVTMAAEVRVREASALAHFGQVAMSYLPAHDTVRLRRLVVTKPDGRIVEHDAEALRDLPVSESGSFEGPVYEDTRVKQVTVPSLEVGDRLAFEIETRRHTPLVAGRFWGDHTFTRTAVVEREVLEIDWDDRLELRIHVAADGVDEEAVPSPEGRRVRRWVHRQRQITQADGDRLERILREAARGRGGPPDVQASSFGSWDDVSAWFAKLTADAEHVTPAVRAKAESLTSAARTPAEKLQALHKFVAQDIRYVSLGFGEGRYRPRRADLTLSTLYGDCKDKHALLAAMGRAVGLELQPALISSSRVLTASLPSPGQFDHVVSRVRLGDADPAWLDATSDVAPTGILMPHLRGKEALAVSADGTAAIVPTPGRARRSTVLIETSGAYGEDGRYRVTTRRELTGDVDMITRLVLKNIDQPSRVPFAESLAKHDGLKGDITIVDVRWHDLRDLTTPLWLEYVAEVGYGRLGQAGSKGVWFPAPSFELKEPDTASTEPHEIGGPMVMVVKGTMTVPSHLTVSAPVPVSIDRDGVRYISSYAVSPGRLSFERRLTTEAEHIAPERFSSYRSLVRAVGADHRQLFAVAPASTSSTATTYEDLIAAGNRAYDRGEYGDAAKLLRRAVDAKPTSGTAWNDLGRALHALGDWNGALEAYAKQIAVEPFHEYAYNNQGLTEWQLGRHEQAEASFRKQIELVPLDKWAHRNLGLLLLDRSRPREAVESFERAVAVTPQNADAHIGLGRALAAVGRGAAAVAAFERAVTVQADPTVWNNVAWWMAEYDLSLDKALDYARQAVAAASAVLSATSLEKPTAQLLGQTSSLAAYWDTLGWIEFKRDRLEEALRFVRASWQVRQDPEVGEHLGRIYERLDRRREAFAVYRTAMGLPRAKDSVAGRARDLATALKPPPNTHDSATLGQEARTVRLKAITPVPKPVEAVLLADPNGVIRAAKPLEGAGNLEQLIGVRLRVDPPDAAPFTLGMLGVFSCVDGRAPCSLLLYRPDQAMMRLAGANGAPPE